jgi:serine O-acetyltransferase
MRLRKDIAAYLKIGRAGGWASVFDLSLVYLILFRLFSGLYQINRKIFLPIRLFEKVLEFLFGVYIPFGAQIGGGLVIFHYHGLIINGRVQIGRDCVLYARACIGNRYPGDGVPVIGDNVVIGTGACIFGPVHIPSGAKIPANAVVTPKTLTQYLQEAAI